MRHLCLTCFPNMTFICLLGVEAGGHRKSEMDAYTPYPSSVLQTGGKAELCEPHMASLSPPHSAVSFPTVGKGLGILSVSSTSTLQVSNEQWVKEEKKEERKGGRRRGGREDRKELETKLCRSHRWRTLGNSVLTIFKT